MEIPSEILNGEPGLYTFTYDGCEYRVVVGDIVPGNPVGVTVHGGGSGGGYYDTLHEQRALLDGQTIEEALNSGTYNVKGQNQIDIFPVTFEGYYSWPDGKQRGTDLVVGITSGIEENLGNPIVYMSEGHSSTSRGAIENAMLYAKSGGNAEQIIAFSLEPAHNTSTYYSDEDIQFMKENNITVLQVRGNSMCGDMQDAINRGMPFIDIDFDLITPNGGRTDEFWVNHRVPRTMLGDLDYSDIANGTFSWADAFGPDENGNYPSYSDEYNGLSYTIHITVKVYNVPGFTNGEEVPLDVLDNYLGSLVMSDEEYLASEIANMRAAVNAAKAFLETSSCVSSYSTSKIPSEIAITMNEVIVYNDLIINKALEMLDKIEQAKDSFTLVDKELYTRAIEGLTTLDLATPAVVKEETHEFEPKKSSSASTTPISYKRPSGSPTGTSVPIGSSTPSKDTEDKTDDNKSDEDDKTKEEVTSTPSQSDDNKEDTSREETTSESREDENTNTETEDEKHESKEDDNSITAPTNKPDKKIPSKTKTSTKKGATKKPKSEKPASEVNTPEEEPTIPVEPEEVPIYPEENEAEIPVYKEPEILEDPPIDVPVDEPVTSNEKITSSKDANILKTVGIAAGIGAGVGAVAYGVNEQIRKKEYDDGFDYSYSTGEEKSDYLEQESETSEYSPYTEVLSEDVGPYNVNEATVGGEE